MRIAALDLGSNSFHLVVVEANLDGSFSPLIREKEMLRLGDRVARTGSIGPSGCDEGIEVLRRFRAIADAHRADEIIALGTAALREALDGPAFCDRARDEAGIDIEIVDGIREAQLIFTAVRSSVLIEPAPALCADLGGGSLELMVGDRRRLAYAASAHLGVGRLTAMFIESDPPTAAEHERLVAHIGRELEPVLAPALGLAPRMLIGTSGTLLCLARMAVAQRDGVVPETMNQLAVASKDLVALSEVIFGLDADERADLPGCDTRRAELLPAGMAVLDQLLSRTGIEEFTVSEWALREGIVLEAIGAHDRSELSADPRALRLSSVLSLCRRSSWRQPHARRVSALACELFDKTRAIHELDEADRELLELIGLAHDIGEHVSRTDHDRHGAYLIENGELRGFSPAEIRLMACVVRFHIRGTPRDSVEQYDVLEDEEKARAQGLIALLRIADALDSSHNSVVEQIEVFVTGERELDLVLRARGEAEVELWALRRKKELFERLFGWTVNLIVIRVGVARYEPDTAEAGLS